MADSVTAVSAAPFVEIVRPYVDVVVTALVGAAISYAAALFQRWTSIKVSQDQLDKINAAAQTQAGLLVAKAADNLAGRSIDAHHPQVQAGAMFIAEALRGALTATKLTPDDVAHMIAAEIGKLQARAAPAVVVEKTDVHA